MWRASALSDTREAQLRKSPFLGVVGGGGGGETYPHEGKWMSQLVATQVPSTALLLLEEGHIRRVTALGSLPP